MAFQLVYMTLAVDEMGGRGLISKSRLQLQLQRYAVLAIQLV